MSLPNRILAVAASVLLGVSAMASAAAKPANANLINLPKPHLFQPTITPKPPYLGVKGYILIDANSGKVLAEKNADKRLQPASLTKLMTLYITSSAIAAKRINLESKVTISKLAWSTGGSRMFLKQGQQVSVRKLIEGIIVDSGNDSCMALAQYVGGDIKNFVKLMNEAAGQLGMKYSHFADPTGLPIHNHYSTPRDLAILARAIVKEFPQDYHWYKQKWLKFNKIRQPNRNRLLWWDPSVDGMKTGHTKGAGYCLIASAERHGMRLISVVMGAPTDNARAADSQRLINYGYRFFETHKLYSAGEALVQPRIWKGNFKHIAMGLVHNFYVTIPSGQYKHLTAKVKMNGVLTAPIIKGKQYGEVMVKLNGKNYADLPLIALQADSKGGVWRRMSDSIALTFHSIFS